MRKVREILRLKHEVKLSHRQVAESLGVSIGVVSKVVNRATLAGLAWDAVADLSEEAVEARLYGARGSPGAARARPDPEWIHTERKRAGVTLELLHPEYLREHLAGYRNPTPSSELLPSGRQTGHSSCFHHRAFH